MTTIEQEIYLAIAPNIQHTIEHNPTIYYYIPFLLQGCFEASSVRLSISSSVSGKGIYGTLLGSNPFLLISTAAGPSWHEGTGWMIDTELKGKGKGTK